MMSSDIDNLTPTAKEEVYDLNSLSELIKIDELSRQIPLSSWEIDCLVETCRAKNCSSKGLAVVSEYLEYLHLIKTSWTIRCETLGKINDHLQSSAQNFNFINSKLNILCRSIIDLYYNICNLRRLQANPCPFLYAGPNSIASPPREYISTLSMSEIIRNDSRIFTSLLSLMKSDKFVHLNLRKVSMILSPTVDIKRYLSILQSNNCVVSECDDQDFEVIFSTMGRFLSLEDKIYECWKRATEENDQATQVYDGFPTLRLPYRGIVQSMKQLEWFSKAIDQYKTISSSFKSVAKLLNRGSGGDSMKLTLKLQGPSKQLTQMSNDSPGFRPSMESGLTDLASTDFDNVSDLTKETTNEDEDQDIEEDQYHLRSEFTGNAFHMNERKAKVNEQYHSKDVPGKSNHSNKLTVSIDSRNEIPRDEMATEIPVKVLNPDMIMQSKSKTDFIENALLPSQNVLDDTYVKAPSNSHNFAKGKLMVPDAARRITSWWKSVRNMNQYRQFKRKEADLEAKPQHGLKQNKSLAPQQGLLEVDLPEERSAENKWIYSIDQTLLSSLNIISKSNDTLRVKSQRKICVWWRLLSPRWRLRKRQTANYISRSIVDEIFFIAWGQISRASKRKYQILVNGAAAKIQMWYKSLHPSKIMRNIGVKAIQLPNDFAQSQNNGETSELKIISDKNNTPHAAQITTSTMIFDQNHPIWTGKSRLSPKEMTKNALQVFTNEICDDNMDIDMIRVLASKKIIFWWRFIGPMKRLQRRKYARSNATDILNEILDRSWIICVKHAKRRQRIMREGAASRIQRRFRLWNKQMSTNRKQQLLLSRKANAWKYWDILFSRIIMAIRLYSAIKRYRLHQKKLGYLKLPKLRKIIEGYFLQVFCLNKENYSANNSQTTIALSFSEPSNILHRDSLERKSYLLNQSARTSKVTKSSQYNLKMTKEMRQTIVKYQKNMEIVKHAIIIQKYVRRMIAYSKLRRAKALRYLQLKFLIFHAKFCLRKLRRLHQRKNVCATVMQRYFRGYAVRLMLYMQFEAALIITKVWKKYKALRNLKYTLRRIERPYKITLHKIRSVPTRFQKSIIKVRVSVWWNPLLHIISASEYEGFLRSKKPQFVYHSKFQPVKEVVRRDKESFMKILQESGASKPGSRIRRSTRTPRRSVRPSMRAIHRPQSSHAQSNFDNDILSSPISSPTSLKRVSTPTSYISPSSISLSKITPTTPQTIHPSEDIESQSPLVAARKFFTPINSENQRQSMSLRKSGRYHTRSSVRQSMTNSEGINERSDTHAHPEDAANKPNPVRESKVVKRISFVDDSPLKLSANDTTHEMEDRAKNRHSILNDFNGTLDMNPRFSGYRGNGIVKLMPTLKETPRNSQKSPEVTSSNHLTDSYPNKRDHIEKITVSPLIGRRRNLDRNSSALRDRFENDQPRQRLSIMHPKDISPSLSAKNNRDILTPTSRPTDLHKNRKTMNGVDNYPRSNFRLGSIRSSDSSTHSALIHRASSLFRSSFLRILSWNKEKHPRRKTRKTMLDIRKNYVCDFLDETIQVPACHGNSIIRFDFVEKETKKIGTCIFHMNSEGRLLYWGGNYSRDITLRDFRRGAQLTNNNIMSNAGSAGNTPMVGRENRQTLRDIVPFLEFSITPGAALRSRAQWGHIRCKGNGSIIRAIKYRHIIMSSLFNPWENLFLSLDHDGLSIYEHRHSIKPVCCIPISEMTNVRVEVGEKIFTSENLFQNTNESEKYMSQHLYDIVLQLNKDEVRIRFVDSRSRVAWYEALNVACGMCKLEQYEKERLEYDQMHSTQSNEINQTALGSPTANPLFPPEASQESVSSRAAQLTALVSSRGSILITKTAHSSPDITKRIVS